VRSHRRQAPARLACVCVAALAAIAVAACGSSSSNNAGTSSGAKPAYCATLSSLQTTVHDLTHLSVSGGVTALLAQVTKLQSDATTLVNQAKGDFPAETSTLQSSVSKFQSEVNSLKSSPSTGQIASVATAAIGVVDAVKGLADSARTKCS
jgi:hypothetical protein